VTKVAYLVVPEEGLLKGRGCEASPVAHAQHEPIVTKDFVLELFGGACHVAREFEKRGFCVLGIDRGSGGGAAIGSVVNMDLDFSTTQDFVMEMLARKKVAFVWLWPPCGTASRVRERRVGRKSEFLTDPQPLRSMEYPCGFPWLDGVEADRVHADNARLEFCAAVIRQCGALGIRWGLLGPAGAYMWAVPCVVELRSHDTHDTVFHQCMHAEGVDRIDRKLRLWHNVQRLTRLQAFCDKSHQHGSWNVGGAAAKAATAAAG
jgi:hypothetical protein